MGPNLFSIGICCLGKLVPYPGNIPKSSETATKGFLLHYLLQKGISLACETFLGMPKHSYRRGQDTYMLTTEFFLGRGLFVAKPCPPPKRAHINCAQRLWGNLNGGCTAQHHSHHPGTCIQMSAPMLPANLAKDNCLLPET